jgi:ABC-type phosphate transport system substrate-binding protein
MNHLTQILLLTAGVVLSQASGAQVAVVAGAGSGASTLTIEQVASLFLGKSAQVPGVSVAILLDQPESASVRELFYAKVTGKSTAQIKAAWSRLVFSGKATPPREIANSAAVKKMVAANPNTLGYIEKSAVDSSVKVLLTVD